VVAVVGTAEGILLFRRPDDSELLAGTWELPWVAAEEGDPAAALAAGYGGRWRLGPCEAEVRHGITFRDIEVAVHRAEVEAGGEVRESREAGWFDAEGRAALPLSSLVGKVLTKLGSTVPAAPPARRSPSRRRG
jgi:adenine-specific DNA glycosylase